MFGASILVAILLLAGSPGETPQPASAQESIEVAVRPPHELRKAIHEALKRSAPTGDPDPYVVTPDLLALYAELRLDTQIEEFDRKRRLGLLRNRLETIAKNLEKTADSPLGRRPQATTQPPDVQSRGDVLAQQGLPAGGGAAGPNARAGQGPQDNGQALVDLIKRTIAPTTWADLGGPGTIYYYRPLRVLVIRQTGEVHEKIGGVMGGLRGK
jgi:hypothetical protein